MLASLFALLTGEERDRGRHTGTLEMQNISDIIKKDAEAFLAHRNKTRGFSSTGSRQK